MKIQFLDQYNSYDILTKLEKELEQSRFTTKISIQENNNIVLQKIRLKESKEYCGSHPGECQNPHRKLKKYKYLEGGDWIEFNDLINDFMDKYKISANITTSVCVVRKDLRRRINYEMINIGSSDLPHYEWDKQGTVEDFQCCITKKIKTKFPKGTPGGL